MNRENSLNSFTGGFSLVDIFSVWHKGKGQYPAAFYDIVIYREQQRLGIFALPNTRSGFEPNELPSENKGELEHHPSVFKNADD